ncbi:hypothetical protein RHSIM_Rhsim03G0014500 [Rhododendron simsii]|uniref:Uncharacterized protein n=1 Tax=Rhododendron simsii TaxID=118357 RepID=A0A834LUW1_RHOSS|nr:hypothetical protein RHSIM_Rhsim03G0014500 [Rhododendron simsii]
MLSPAKIIFPPPKSTRYRRHPPPPLLREGGEINSVIQSDESGFALEVTGAFGLLRRHARVRWSSLLLSSAKLLVPFNNHPVPIHRRSLHANGDACRDLCSRKVPLHLSFISSVHINYNVFYAIFLSGEINSVVQLDGLGGGVTQFQSVEEGDSATSSTHILPLTLPALEEIDRLDSNLQIFRIGTDSQRPKPECYREQPQRPKPKHNRRHPPRPLLQKVVCAGSYGRVRVAEETYKSALE